MATVIGGMTGALQGTLTGVLNKGNGLLDRFFPPERREELYARATKFATEQPAFASFLLSQIAISGIPLALFVVFTIGVFVFALVAALVIGLLGALLFTAFCVGVALLVLLPVLFITTFAAAFIWLWGVGAYYLVKWFNQKDVPGVTSDSDSEDKKSSLEGLDALNGAAKAPVENGDTKGAAKKGQEQKKSGKQGNGALDKLPGGMGDKVGDVGKATGVDAGNVGDVKKKVDVGNATKTVDGIKGSVPGGIL